LLTTSVRATMAAEAPRHPHGYRVQATHGAAHPSHADSRSPYIGVFVLVALAVLILIMRNACKGRNERRDNAAAEQSADVSQRLDRINRGALPEIQPIGIVPVLGERFFYEQRAQYGQTYSQRVTPAEIKLSMYPSGTASEPASAGNAATPKPFQTSCGGATARSMYQTFTWRSKLTAHPKSRRRHRTAFWVTTYPDGLAIQVDGVGMMQFRTGDVVLGTLFQKIIQRRSQPPAADATPS
jgi:hypothetical protein